jgi:hypothetical protein
MEATGDGPINYEELQKWMDWMEKNKISWVSWSITDKNETCSMLKPEAGDFGNWKLIKENAQTLETIGSGWIDWRDWDDTTLNELLDTLITDARLKNYWWK